MTINYKIPMTLYDKLLFSICEEYDSKIKRLVSITKNIPKNRYQLPKTDEDKVTLRMGGVNAYIFKAPHDLFDIEYKVEFRINSKQFIKFVNEFMYKNGYRNFDFNMWVYKDELFFNLYNYIATRYGLMSKIHQCGGYIQFDIKVFTHPDIRIIDM